MQVLRQNNLGRGWLWGWLEVIELIWEIVIGL